MKLTRLYHFLFFTLFGLGNHYCVGQEDIIEDFPDDILIEDVPIIRADSMPYLKACANVEDLNQRAKCTHQEISTIVAKEFSLPKKVIKEVEKTCGKKEYLIYVRFIVQIDGKVGSEEILKGDCTLLNEEAMKVVRNLPKFEPGVNNGKLVPVMFILPFKVEL